MQAEASRREKLGKWDCALGGHGYPADVCAEHVVAAHEKMLCLPLVIETTQPLPASKVPLKWRPLRHDQ